MLKILTKIEKKISCHVYASFVACNVKSIIDILSLAMIQYGIKPTQNVTTILVQMKLFPTTTIATNDERCIFKNIYCLYK